MKDLKEKVKKIYEQRQLRLKKREGKLNQSLEGATPHTVLIATLKHRVYIERTLFVSAIVILSTFHGISLSETSKMAELIENKKIYLIPSYVDGPMTPRPNTLTDEQVFSFAEEYINNYTNINYDDIDVRKVYLERYMQPSLKARYKAEMVTRIPFWKKNRIDQVFSYGHIKDLKRTTEEITYKDSDGNDAKRHKTYYEVSVWGTVRKYVDGAITDPYEERVTMKFTTTSKKITNSWIFEVVDIERKTQKEIEEEKLVKKEIESVKKAM